MFLSKIFSIFKKKNDNPKDIPASSGGASGAVVPPSNGAIGTAVGMSQPGQQPSPQPDLGPTQVAQAPQDPFSTPAAPSPPADTSFSSDSSPSPALDTTPTGPSLDGLSGGSAQPGTGSDVSLPAPEESVSSAPDITPPSPPAEGAAAPGEPVIPPSNAPEVPPAAPPSDDNQNIAV